MILVCDRIIFGHNYKMADQKKENPSRIIKMELTKFMPDKVIGVFLIFK